MEYPWIGFHKPCGLRILFPRYGVGILLSCNKDSYEEYSMHLGIPRLNTYWHEQAFQKEQE